MPVIYEQAPLEIHLLAQEIIQRHHPDLKFNEKWVQLCILMASNEDKESDDSPIKCHGYPAAAVISAISYKQCVDKRADAEIILDELIWENLPQPQQIALLDHEITHLEIDKDKDGFIKTDDLGRPKLKLRLHDWFLGGFRSVAERYGADALEVIEARKFEELHGDAALARDSMLPGMK